MLDNPGLCSAICGNAQDLFLQPTTPMLLYLFSISVLELRLVGFLPLQQSHTGGDLHLSHEGYPSCGLI